MKNRVVVIEDQPEILMNIVQVLEFEGLEVVGVDNGDDGLQQAKTLLPDLIICDINLPKKDGYSILQELKNVSSTASIPFIFLTALTDPSARQYGISLGADNYLTKPFKNIDLISAVRTHLSNSEE